MKKQNKNKSYKQLYKTKGRLDMSKGGRVKLSHGGRPIREDYRNMADFREAMDSWLSNPDHTATSDDNTTTTTTTTAAESQAKLDEFEDARRQRVIDTGAGAADIAQGNFGAGVNPKADVANILNEDGDVSSNTIADTSEIKEGGTRAKVNKVADTPAEKVEKMAKVGQVKEASNVSGQTYNASTGSAINLGVAQGSVSRGPIGDIQGTIKGGGKFATVDAIKAEAALADGKDLNKLLEGTYLVDTPEGDDTTITATPDAEREQREIITGVPAGDGQAAKIVDTVGYKAAEQRKIKGKAAQGEAAEMLRVVGNLPPDIAASIVEDPAVMIAQVDTNPVEVNAAIAALPTEALVSSQMESLLGGMEDGTIPMWARPAIDAVNQGMAARGISVSTVGRDSLFNAIIQTAMPMAQSNAQALQTRAAQNLGNEQQANLQEAAQEQQLRLQNLANRQGAASQTAQMSQQMKTMQSQFTQDAVMTSAQMQQQTRTQNLNNLQQAAVIQSQNEQQANMTNLGNEQQINMAELQIEANAAGADQSAINQEQLADMQISADFLAKNEGFKQQMELANLSNDQQMKLANLSSRNLAASETLSNGEKIELANLNKTMQTNQLQAQIAQQMGIAQLNVDQQSAIFAATTTANMDMTKFNAAQQVELANSKFMQTVALTDMNAEQQAIMQNATAMASMDIANLSTRERLAVSNAQSFLAMDMANLSNRQQSAMLRGQQDQQRMLTDQAAQNAAKQFGAANQQQADQFMVSMSAQIDQYNVSQRNTAEQFNAQSKNAANARDSGRTADVNKANASILNQTGQFNAQLDFQRDQWNAANEQAVINSNTTWRRQANMADTAAQNAVNQQNAQNAFGLTSQAQSFLWQELRDQADYDFRFADNTATRKLNAMIAAAGSEGDAAKNWATNFKNASTVIDSLFT